MILLKTHGKHMDGVIRNAKHALKGRLRYVKSGDIVLVSQTEASLAPDQLPIRHLMKYVRCYPDADRESFRIWGSQWPYIVEGRDLRRLKVPFRMSDVQVSEKNYGQGGTICYVDPSDEDFLLSSGFLVGIDALGRAS